MEEMRQATAVQQPAVLSVGNWIVTILITIVPIVNIIMLFVWAFGDNTNPNKANWAKAQLVLFAVLIGLYMIFFIVMLSFWR